MKSKLLFFVLLAIPGCLAYIKLKPKGYYDQCPYANETFQQRFTLVGLEDYISQDKWATFGCIKEVEDYEKAVEAFVKDMAKVTEDFKAKTPINKQLERNYPYFVSKALQNTGEEIIEYVKLLKKASDGGELEKVKHYDKTLKQIVIGGYGLYVRTLERLENREPCEHEIINARKIIHTGCEPGMKRLKEVGKYFKDCMKLRLSQSKE